MTEDLRLQRTPIGDNTIIDGKVRILSRELNFDFAQFFYPKERGERVFAIRHFRSEVVDGEGNTKIISAVVSPNAVLGTLTTFDERVLYALVEIWYEQNKPDVGLFSEREIARKINVEWGGNTGKAINDSLSRLRTVGITWNGSFYLKNEKRLIDIKNPFTILNHLQVISTKDKYFKAQIAEFGFDRRFISNLESSHFRPIRFDVILSFRSPLAQAIYTLVDRQLYGTKEYHRTSAGLLLEDLGLIGQNCQKKKTRILYLKRVRDELLNVPTGYGEVIEKFDIESSRKHNQDALVQVKRSGPARIKGKKVEVFKVKRSESSEKPHQEAKSQVEDNIPHPSEEKPSGAQAQNDALEVITYFDKVFDIQSSRSGNVLAKAAQMLRRDGLEKTKFLIDFARREAPKTNYEPQTFSGITQYRAEALKAWKAHVKFQKQRKKEADKVAKIQLDQARTEYRNAHQEAYEDSIDILFYSLEANSENRESLAEFERFRADAREKIEREMEGNTFKEKRLKIFDARCQRIESMVEFFKDDPNVHIPDFWEWDSTQNPNSFRMM